jgi:hypothetical protein
MLLTSEGTAMPSTASDPYNVATAAAEGVRQLNHLTLNGPVLSAPEISSIVRALMDLVDRLPQALDQLAGHLEKQQAAGQVRMEGGRDPARPVSTVTTALRRAALMAAAQHHTNYGDPAGEFSAELHEAAGWLYNMGAPFVPDEDD